MRAAAGTAYLDRGSGVEIHYGAGRPARIDGTVGSLIAVEVESRVSKQVRGAVLDLICHPYPKKLLILMPVHMNDADITAQQCRYILGKFLATNSFRVVVLEGTGETPQHQLDVESVREALFQLGFTP